MHHEGNRAGQDTEDRRHGDGNDHDRQQLGIGGNIRSSTAVPPTVLVTEMDNGALIVQGRPDGEEDPPYCTECMHEALRWCARPVAGECGHPGGAGDAVRKPGPR